MPVVFGITVGVMVVSCIIGDVTVGSSVLGVMTETSVGGEGFIIACIPDR